MSDPLSMESVPQKDANGRIHEKLIDDEVCRCFCRCFPVFAVLCGSVGCPFMRCLIFLSLLFSLLLRIFY